jgi:hypothetical protein
MSSVTNEALLDAKELIALAEKNAQYAINETFQPKIQRMISSKLAETEDEDMDDEEDVPPAPQAVDPAQAPVQDPTAVAVAPETTPTGVAPAADAAPVAQDPTMVAPEGDPTDDEDDDVELEALIRELNGEETEDPMEDPAPTEENVNIDDLELENFIKKLKEGDSCETDDEEMTKESFQRLKKENIELAKANAIMKNAINEAILLNTKLRYSIRVNRKFGLNEDQNLKIFKAFDRAKSVKEAEIIYVTLCENLAVKSSPNVRISKSPMIEGLSSKTVRTVKKVETKNPINESIKDRWKVLSGQEPLKN